MNKDLDRKVFINVPDFYVRDEFFDKNSNAEIDILIAKSIEILNKKGYETRFCCSGHLKKGKETCAYITFKDFYDDFPYLYGWELDNSGQVENCGSTIRCFVKKPTYRKLKRIHSRLRDWCKKLPKLN